MPETDQPASITPPRADAGNDSRQADPTPEQRAAFWHGVKDGKHAVEAARDAATISPAAPPNSPAHAQQQPQGTQATASAIEPGNVPPSSRAVRDGPELANGRPVETVVMRRVRGPDGRLYNPDKMPERFAGEPESPRKDGPKAQSAALLKPDGTRGYGDSATQAGSNQAESQPLNPGITGLSDIPAKWGELPSNVSLSVEIAWVQSERLRVVKETPGRGVKVDLSKARVPAPSMSALSWLETSIRSYAKFVEVASKQASSGQDEAEFVRRERMQLGEIRSILAEMLPASG